MTKENKGDQKEKIEFKGRFYLSDILRINKPGFWKFHNYRWGVKLLGALLIIICFGIYSLFEKYFDLGNPEAGKAKIIYCGPCNYGSHARRVSSELSKIRYIKNVQLMRENKRYQFDVEIEGKLIFSKFKTKRLPEPKEISDLYFQKKYSSYWKAAKRKQTGSQNFTELLDELKK